MFPGTPSAISCPVCHGEATSQVASYTAKQAAGWLQSGQEHLEDDAELERILLDLWKPEGRAEVRRCEDCGFGFAWPHIAGDAAFYNALMGDEPSYPTERWEFARTVDALRSSPPGRLLEIGAGSGWFLRQVRDELPPWQCEALDYSEGAVRQLREAGFGASVGSAADLADDRASHGSFDAVCLFQTLEHMDSPHERMAAIRAVLAPKGRVFISVPNAAATDNQERLAGLPDTPPNHVGRWTVEALTRLFSAHGLKITQCELGPASRDAEIYRLAYWAMIADRWKGKKSPAFLVLRHASGRLRSLAEIRLVRRYSRRIGRACPNPPPADIWVEATVL